MNKDELLSLLDDSDVREKILSVMNQPEEDTQDVDDESQPVEGLQREFDIERKINFADWRTSLADEQWL